MKKRSLKIRHAKNYLFIGVIGLCSVLLMVPLILIFYQLITLGGKSINLTFLTQIPKSPGEAGGGIYNAIVGTTLLVALASLISIPLGILTGVYISEYQNSRLSAAVRTCVDIMQGTPSIVIGIIVYTWVVRPMSQFSAISGGIALGIMMLPVIIKTTEETLGLIPMSLKEASLALGVPYYKTILKVVIPTGFSGILTGILLSISRVAGETAPLLFTAFGNAFLTYSIFKPISAIPLLIFNYATSPYEEWHQLAWGASLLVVGMILLLNLVAKGVTKR